MTSALESLINAAKSVKQTSRQTEQQRRSFAYGNTKFENQDITKEMIDEQAEKMPKSI